MGPHGDKHQTIQMNTAIDPNNIKTIYIYNYKKDKKYGPSCIKWYEPLKRVREAKIRTHLDTMS